MTSPPPSETGATAEERYAEIVRLIESWPGSPTVEVGNYMVSVRELIRAAKREAHLEDARAGCPMCANGDKIKRGDYGWHHYYEGEDEVYGCLRPEVWDSLTGGAK